MFPIALVSIKHLIYIMEKEHNFQTIPFNYALCLKRECPKAATCLRQLVERQIPDNVEYWTIISPKYQTTLEGDCPHYRSDTKNSYARGLKNMLDNMPYSQMKDVVSHLMNLFGRRSYYRVRNGERQLSPEEQKSIQNILKRCGVTEPQKFDAYIEDYAW